MGLLPRGADLSTGLDVAFLGLIALGVVQFARTVTAVPARTPRLLPLSADDAVSPTAPELGLLAERDAAVETLDLGIAVGEPVWTALALGTLVLVVGGPLWYWFLRPRVFPPLP